MRKQYDIAAGKKYGALTFIATVEPSRFLRQKDHWGLWQCDCGKQKRMRVSSVVNGGSRSCGCANQRGMRAVMQGYYSEAMARRRKAL